MILHYIATILAGVDYFLDYSDTPYIRLMYVLCEDKETCSFQVQFGSVGKTHLVLWGVLGRPATLIWYSLDAISTFLSPLAIQLSPHNSFALMSKQYSIKFCIYNEIEMGTIAFHQCVKCVARQNNAAKLNLVLKQVMCTPELLSFIYTFHSFNHWSLSDVDFSSLSCIFKSV